MEIRNCVPDLSYTTSNSAYGTDWEKGEYMKKSFTQSTPYKGLPVAAKLQESPAVADKPARRLRKVCTVYVRAVGLL